MLVRTLLPNQGVMSLLTSTDDKNDTIDLHIVDIAVLSRLMVFNLPNRSSESVRFVQSCASKSRKVSKDALSSSMLSHPTYHADH